MTQDLSYVHPDMINPALNATTILLDPNDPGKGTLADVITALQGAIRAKADLDKIGGVIVDAQLPPLGEITTITRPDAASMYGADLQGGDLCVRSDEGDSVYMLLRRPAAVPTNWQLMYAPDSGVNPAATAFIDLTDTPTTITPHMVYKGNAAGTAVTQGVMKTSEIVNDSAGTGGTLKEALDNLNSSNGNAVSQADLNTVLADKADANHTHDASELNNDSSVAGAKISDALDNLKTDLGAVPDTADITSQINAALADKADVADLANKADANHTHDASELNNDSSVAGVKISDALDNLKTDLDAVPDTVDITSQINAAMAGKVDQTELDSLKAQAATAQTAMQADIDSKANASDLAAKADANHTHDASELNNDSNVTGATIRDALNNIQTMVTAGMTPLGGFDASTNTPALSNGSGNDGDMYWVTTSGTLSPAVDGITDLDVGDIVFAANGKWIRVGREDDISSVFGRKGAVIAQAGDYTGNQITNDSNVAGSTVRDALNNLQADLDDTPAQSDVTSQINTAIVGKANTADLANKADQSDVTALQTDMANKADANHTHDASDLNNDSSVAGAKISDALNNLKTDLDAASPVANPVTMTDTLANGGRVTDLPAYQVTSSDYRVIGDNYGNLNGSNYQVNIHNLQIATLTQSTNIRLTRLQGLEPEIWANPRKLSGPNMPAAMSYAVTLVIDNTGGHAVTWTGFNGMKLIAKGGSLPDITGICRISIQFIFDEAGNQQAIISKIDDDLQEVV